MAHHIRHRLPKLRATGDSTTRILMRDFSVRLSLLPRFPKALRLCASYENICQYAKSLWRFPLQSRLLDVSLSPIRNVGRLSVKA